MDTNLTRAQKKLDHFSICACHPWERATLIFSVSFQFYRMSPERQSEACSAAYKYQMTFVKRRRAAAAISIQVHDTSMNLQTRLTKSSGKPSHLKIPSPAKGTLITILTSRVELLHTN